MSKKNKEINKVILLPLSEIHKNPNQPRKYFDTQAIQELAASIEENGLLQPVTVRKMNSNYYELVAGERRTHAYKILGLEYIPAIVEDFTNEQSAVLSLIENLQRKDLNFFEEADGIQRLIEELGYSQQQVSTRIGKAQSTIANKLRLLKFPLSIRKLIQEKELTERHARALLRLENESIIIQAINYISDNVLNVEQAEDYIGTLLEPQEDKAQRTRLFIIKDMRIFVNTINKAVAMLNSAGIPAVSNKRDSDECIEITIQIPKKSVVKQKQVNI